MTFLSNSMGTIKGGGSSVCWDPRGPCFKFRFWIFVRLLNFFWDLQSAISYIRVYQQGALYCACICCFTKNRGNKFSSEASRQKVKHFLVHPGSPESLSLPCFVGSHFLSDLLKCLYSLFATWSWGRRFIEYEMFIGNAVYSLAFVWGFFYNQLSLNCAGDETH